MARLLLSLVLLQVIAGCMGAGDSNGDQQQPSTERPWIRKVLHWAPGEEYAEYFVELNSTGAYVQVFINTTGAPAWVVPAQAPIVSLPPYQEPGVIIELARAGRLDCSLERARTSTSTQLETWCMNSARFDKPAQAAKIKLIGRGSQLAATVIVLELDGAHKD